jgi:hypothetical protein
MDFRDIGWGRYWQSVWAIGDVLRTGVLSSGELHVTATKYPFTRTGSATGGQALPQRNRGCRCHVGVKRRNVFGEEEWFVAHGPGIPRGFLFNDRADERDVEAFGVGGGADEIEKFEVGHGEEPKIENEK